MGRTERRAWTKREDDEIVRLVEENGTKKWSLISDKLNASKVGPTTRTGKQCRARWMTQLVRDRLPAVNAGLTLNCFAGPDHIQGALDRGRRGNYLRSTEQIWQQMG